MSSYGRLCLPVDVDFVVLFILDLDDSRLYVRSNPGTHPFDVCIILILIFVLLDL